MDFIHCRVSPASYSGSLALGNLRFLNTSQLFNLGLGMPRGQERLCGVAFTGSPRRATVQLTVVSGSASRGKEVPGKAGKAGEKWPRGERNTRISQ